MPLPSRIPPISSAEPPVGDAFSRQRHALWLITGFWRSRASLLCWPMLIALVGSQFTTVYLALWSNDWDRRLGEVFEKRDGAAFPGLVVTFLLIHLVSGAAFVIQILLNGYTELRWRTWLTENYVGRWLRNTRYLRMERSALIDNPDQRIAEDIRDFAAKMLTTFTGIILAVTSVSSFAILLWRLSSTVRLAIGSMEVALPGDLVWACLLYALLGSWLIAALGKPLIRRSMEQQHFEADFRFLLINIRRNAEQIAFARAASAERERLHRGFGKIYGNTMALIRAQITVSTGQKVYEGFGSILPLLLTLPRYFAGAITLGTLLQVRSACSAFLGSLAWFVQSFAGLAQLIAIINRLKGFDDALARPMPDGITFATHGDDLHVANLDILLPSGEPLLHLDAWTIRPGERWAIRGPSGVGKSTLLRAIAGLWPASTGAVSLPETADIMFLPQKPYFPVGSLREALAFPDPAATFTDEAYHRALTKANLQRLTGDLDHIRSWVDELSPGEQQRLGFARIFLHKPAVLFLDEATSALDPNNASAMYDLLAQNLPGLTLISIVHADFLSSLHDRILAIENGMARPIAAAPDSAVA